MPLWHELAVTMKKDPEANAAFGWVVEMWAYSIASAQVQQALNPEPRTPNHESYLNPKL